MSDIETNCPVRNCNYTGPIASVAGHVSGKRDSSHDWGKLGFEGANDYKRRQRASLIKESATIGWLTDSHIGKEKGGYGKTKWQISPIDDLEDSAKHLASFDLDTVVYTGDFFQKEEHGFDRDNQRSVKSIFKSHLSDALPVRYIRGNHPRYPNRDVWSYFEKHQIAEPLTTEPFVVGDTAVYGIDYHTKDEWKNPPRLNPTNAKYRILCLHQTVMPFRKAKNSEIDLREVLPKISEQIRGVPEFVFLGHLHEVIDKSIIVNGQKVRVLNNGATTRIGNKRNSFPPSSSLFTTNSGQARYWRFPN